jgi:hypothetical protein
VAEADFLREAVRDRLLRRADWRFLIPNSRPATSICFDGGPLARAVGLISDGQVATPRDAPGACDLAVASNPDRTTLAAAWAALRPGGALYAEWSSPLAGGALGIRRRLESAGFQGIACYWTWPSPARPQLWLPLEAPGALRYFLCSRPKPRRVVRRVLHTAREVAWRLSLRTHFTFPICAVARKPALVVGYHPATSTPQPGARRRAPRVAGMNAELASAILERWEVWGLGPSPTALSWLGMAVGERSINKVVGLVFAEPDPRPRLAVKLPRVTEAVPGLIKEAAALRAVQALRPGGVSGVPRVLSCRKHDNLLVLVETAMVGRPIFTQLRRSTYRDLALAATTWLADLAGRPIPRPRTSWWNRLVEPILADFDESFGRVLDPGLLRETVAILATLGDLPIVCEQRDFSPWNVLITTEGQVVVLDWESAELQGLPALDLLYFLAYLVFFLDGAITSGRYRESYRASLDASTLAGAVSVECLTRYADRIGIAPAALDPLRLLVWLLHSRSEYRRLVDDAGGRPEPAALRRSLFVSLWEEEVRRAVESRKAMCGGQTNR